MSMTFLMFRDTPWTNWDHEQDLPDVASHIDILDQKSLSGEVYHGMIEVRDKNTDENQMPDNHGYVVLMNDAVVHSNDLYVLFYSVNGPSDVRVSNTCRLIRDMIKTDAVDGYVVGKNVVIRFDGGADAVRTVYAEVIRTGLRVVH